MGPWVRLVGVLLIAGGVAASTRAAEPEIVVVPGPNGLMIASEDLQALDEFERLLSGLAGQLAAGNEDVTIFYLKHAKAEALAETLEAVLVGRTGGSGMAAGRESFATVPGGAFGGPRGGPESGGFGPAGRTQGRQPRAEVAEIFETSQRDVPLRIVPDPRLNALIVQANARDTELIEQLLKILDQPQSPEEVLAQAKPRIIPVYSVPAEDIAEVIRQVYQDRMTGSGRGVGGQGPFQGPAGGPQQLLQQLAMLSGRGARQGRAAEESPRLSLGVDFRTNSLIVAAPDPLFREIRELVRQLDRTAGRSTQSVEVVALHGAGSGVLLQALPALMGDRVRISQTRLASPPSVPTGVQPPSQPAQPPPVPAAAQTGVLVGQPRAAGLPQGFPGSQATPAGRFGAERSGRFEGLFGAPGGMAPGFGEPVEEGMPEGPLPFQPPEPAFGPEGQPGPRMGGPQPGQAPGFQGRQPGRFGGSGPVPAGPGPPR